MTERFVSFGCDDEQLVGILHVPTDRSSAVGIVVVVGGPQYRVGSHRQFVLMARAMTAAGYPVLRFDYRGMGDSSGSNRTFDSVNDDISAAVAELQRQLPEVRSVVLFGLCDAASAVMIYASSRDERIAGWIIANPWVRTESTQSRTIVRHYYRRRVLQASFWTRMFSGKFDWQASLTSAWAHLRKAGGPRSGDEDVGHFVDRMARGTGAIRAPMLCLLSGNDLTAREFDVLCTESTTWRALMHRKHVSIARFPDADHTFSLDAQLQAATRTIVQWLASQPADV